MKVAEIPIEKSGFISSTIIDYLKGTQDLRPFYSLPPNSDSIGEAIESRSFPAENRKILVETLLNQYRNTFGEDGIPSEVSKNILSLADSNTFCVTTGQQLHIYLGPLFVFYKVLSAINLAEELCAKYPGKHFVPIFWMVTEDHDFEEINKVEIFGKKFVWEYPEEIGPVGKLKTEGLKDITSEIAKLDSSDRFREYVSIFETAYEKFPNLTEASRFLINHFFGKYGLVVLDPADEELKRVFVPFMVRDALSGDNYRIVNETTARLKELKFSTQINPREINLFYLRDKLRERIVRNEEGNVFEVLNTPIRFSAEELENEIRNHPASFSPNVVLRPLYQESILPGVVYVAGANELNYWLQLKEIFSENNLEFPVVYLRKSLILVGEKIYKAILNSGLKIEDMFSDEEVIMEKVFKEKKALYSIQDEIDELKSIHDRIIDTLQATNMGNMKEWVTETKRHQKEMNKLENLLKGAFKEQVDSSLSKNLSNIKINNFDFSAPQERKLSIIHLLSMFKGDFVDFVKANVNTSDLNLCVIKF